MGRTTLLNWKQLSKGQTVHYKTGSGWRTCTVHSIYEDHATVLATEGSKTKTISIYDKRNIALETRAEAGRNRRSSKASLDLGL